MLPNKKGMTLVEVLATLAITLLIMAAVFSFFIGAQRGAAQTRRAAYSGQAVEMALTQLRNELAGALWLGSGPDGSLRYDSARDELRWTIELKDGILQRVLIQVDEYGNEIATIKTLSRDIDEFTFLLPAEGEEVVTVTVASGEFQLNDNIFLRNWDLTTWIGEVEEQDYPLWRPNIRYYPGERAIYNGRVWMAKVIVSGGGSNAPGGDHGYWEDCSF